MKPDASYVEMQSELRTLRDRHDLPARQKELSIQSEAKFKAAWKLGADRLRLAARLRAKLSELTKRQGQRIAGLDHCTYYAGMRGQRVIVSQPYGKPFGAVESELKRALTLDSGISPQVISATEWAYYHPGSADLIILSFPYRYGKSLPSRLKQILKVRPDCFDRQTNLLPA